MTKGTSPRRLQKIIGLQRSGQERYLQWWARGLLTIYYSVKFCLLLMNWLVTTSCESGLLLQTKMKLYRPLMRSSLAVFSFHVTISSQNFVFKGKTVYIARNRQMDRGRESKLISIWFCFTMIMLWNRGENFHITLEFGETLFHQFMHLQNWFESKKRGI